MWYPLTDIIKGAETFYDEGILFLYCFSVWHSVQIFEGADMVPANAHQAIVASILIFFAAFIHAHILGTMGVVLHALNHKSAKFQEQMEFATTAMKNMKLNSAV